MFMILKQNKILLNSEEGQKLIRKFIKFVKKNKVGGDNKRKVYLVVSVKIPK